MLLVTRTSPAARRGATRRSGTPTMPGAGPTAAPRQPTTVRGCARRATTRRKRPAGVPPRIPRAGRGDIASRPSRRPGTGTSPGHRRCLERQVRAEAPGRAVRGVTSSLSPGRQPGEHLAGLVRLGPCAAQLVGAGDDLAAGGEVALPAGDGMARRTRRPRRTPRRRASAETISPNKLVPSSAKSGEQHADEQAEPQLRSPLRPAPPGRGSAGRARSRPSRRSDPTMVTCCTGNCWSER